VEGQHAGKKLDGLLRALAGVSWPTARDAVRTGKVWIDGTPVTDPQRRVAPGSLLEVRPAAPRPHVARLAKLAKDLIVYVDPSVVVVRKPAGVSSVPFGDESPEEARATLDAQVRDILARRATVRAGRAPLGVVHRLDKETSGLLVFARTVAAKRHLGNQFRQHTTERKYLAIVHGRIVSPVTFRSHLLEDRGDGLRGSAGPGRREGHHAVTHVTPLEPLAGATLVACRLETGRTHQIRIHLSEAGHPIVGEPVYIRHYRGERLPAPRLMLHATELGFVHPATEQTMRFSDDPPPDFEGVLARLSPRSAEPRT
jgi:23S rRNA pseudouridine1911/1915/1917 synthase